MHHTAFLKPASVTSATRRSPPCQQPSCKPWCRSNGVQNINVGAATSFAAINFPVLLIDDFSTPEKNQSFSNEIDETKNQEYKWREEAFRKGFPCLPTT
ncbi:uncharacterized protein [Triticum aestivum]|uniref:uncharacterized protein isoform X4 n=1 Tax=Triticum aestivum TaxID=4565 RepID=UPI00098B0DCF|nr:uncharacterized protein LOC109775947 isoform X5 [Aegilops tauschii subsp. strangulata]XP_044374263.1 uncharacterized protein LOC123096559 isoform X4 [Triticum aestivum]